jgi:polysaccharide export outer membrane protein
MIGALLLMALAAGQGSVSIEPIPASAVEGCRAPATPATDGAASSRTAAPSATGAAAAFLVPPEPDYTIGVDDVLGVSFWREDALSTEVVVRSDGKISLPLINDIQAAGLTPLELCSRITEAARTFVQGPIVSVIVKAVNSRKVYVTGMVGRSGVFPITGPMTVMQLIAIAGGLQDFADAKNVLVVRTEGGKTSSYRVNYEDLSRGRNLHQNILLKPGDTIVVR